MEKNEKSALKCVFVGDRSVGKTTLLYSLTLGRHPDFDIPYTEERNHAIEFTHQGKTYNLGLVDTAADEDNDRIRPLAYPDTDVFVLCFSPAQHGALNNVFCKWSKEVAHHCPNAPIILLATKTDRRSDPKTIEMFDRARQGSINTPEEGQKMAYEIGAERYLECSSTAGEGLQEVLAALVEVGLSGKKTNKKDSNKKDSKQKNKQDCNIM